MEQIKISYFSSVGAQGALLTPKLFNEILNNYRVRANINQFRKTHDDAYKRSLPAIAWQAFFPDGKRNNATGQWNGLYVLDVDHVTPFEVGKDIAAVRLKELGVYLYFVTASGEGMKFIADSAVCQKQTIAECQQWLAAALGVDYDAATKDVARLSFCPSIDDVKFFRPEIFTLQREMKKPLPLSPVQNAGEYVYKGAKFSQICKGYFANVRPSTGERNNAYYLAALRLRDKCKYNEQAMFDNFPDWGLSAEERHATLRSAINAEVRGKWEQEETPAEVPALTAPRLPAFFEYLSAIAPPDFRPAIILSALPMLATYFTHYRFRYCDGMTQPLSLQTVVVAPPASGKSVIKIVYDFIMNKMKQSDAAEREAEQEEREAFSAKGLKDAVYIPSRRFVIRLLPSSISQTMFLRRMHDADGRHCFGFYEEMDSLAKGNRSSWNDKNDIFRLAFDAGEYGQDYLRQDSFSGFVKVMYNYVALGTPMQIQKFFKTAENGLVSRTIFCVLPDLAFKALPVFGAFNPDLKGFLEMKLADAERISGNVEVEKNINGLALQWLDKEREKSAMSLDTARFNASKRAAQISSRLCHVVMLMCEDDNFGLTQQQAMFDFFADYISLNQRELFDFNFAGMKNNLRKPRDIFPVLPQHFSYEQLSAVLYQNGVTTEIRRILRYWEQAGYINEISEHQFEKLK